MLKKTEFLAKLKKLFGNAETVATDMKAKMLLLFVLYVHIHKHISKFVLKILKLLK